MRQKQRGSGSEQRLTLTLDVGLLPASFDVAVLICGIVGFRVTNRRAGNSGQREAGDGTSWLPTVAVGLLSGLLAGFTISVVARFAMRLIAMAAGQPAVFTVVGTGGVFLLSAIPAVLIGLVFGIVRSGCPGQLL